MFRSCNRPPLQRWFSAAPPPLPLPPRSGRLRANLDHARGGRGWGWGAPGATAEAVAWYTAPAQGVPVYTAPAQGVPVYKAPARGVPVCTAPARGVPVYKAPARCVSRLPVCAPLRQVAHTGRRGRNDQLPTPRQNAHASRGSSKMNPPVPHRHLLTDSHRLGQPAIGGQMGTPRGLSRRARRFSDSLRSLRGRTKAGMLPANAVWAPSAGGGRVRRAAEQVCLGGRSGVGRSRIERGVG
jgi:hypothetical protein